MKRLKHPTVTCFQAARSPYKANAITTFGRILACPFRVLKDFVQLMKLELVSFHYSISRLRRKLLGISKTHRFWSKSYSFIRVRVRY